MNFPLVSKEYSFFPLSTPKMFTFPTWVPVARYWESGEKAKVQVSTGPASINLPVCHFPSPRDEYEHQENWMQQWVGCGLCPKPPHPAGGPPDSTAGPASHHAISRPSPGHPGILWPLSQSFLSCLTPRQLTRWHHHGLEQKVIHIKSSCNF